MLEPAMLIGLGAVAIWTHLRFPGLRPGSLMRAAVQVILSFGAFALLPAVLTVLLPLLASHALQIVSALALLMLTLTYLLLSWVWLIARILHDLLGGTPRGGHPAASES
jgi:CBS domain containing-hemolysin-like protein